MYVPKLPLKAVVGPACGVGLMLSVAALPAQAQLPQVATIDANLVVKVRPAPGTKVRAFASVILLGGGNGVLNLNSAGDTRDLQGNFLIRSARRFHYRRLNVAMLDAEPLPDIRGRRPAYLARPQKNCSCRPLWGGEGTAANRDSDEDECHAGDQFGRQLFSQHNDPQHHCRDWIERQIQDGGRRRQPA